MALPLFEDKTSIVISMPKITTEWQRFELLGADGLYELLRFRQGIFAFSRSRRPRPRGPASAAAGRRCARHLLPFYRSFGFEPTGEPYDDFWLTHVDMELRR
jgi:predicted GNAT family N-acyltransferase